MKERKRLFSVREIRALALLLPIIAVTVWIVCSVSRCSSDTAEQMYADRLLENDGNLSPADDTTTVATVSLHEFDPNTVTYAQLRAMGVEKSAAVSLIRYRSNGKVFRIKEDVAGTYNVSDSLYFALEPYIVIAEQFRSVRRVDSYVSHVDYDKKPSKLPAKRSDSLFNFNPNRATVADYRSMGFSERQAEVIVNYIEMIGGVRSVEEFGECYVVDSARLELLRPYMVIPQTEKVGTVVEKISAEAEKLELNGADTTALIKIVGIGELSARAIVEYRSRLGGYHDLNQLKELRVITERNFENIVKQIWVDSCKIQKIDINFASPKELGEHPYMTPQRVRKILKNRQLKGGWTSIEEMIGDKTLTDAEAVRMAPYLQFGQ